MLRFRPTAIALLIGSVLTLSMRSGVPSDLNTDTVRRSFSEACLNADKRAAFHSLMKAHEPSQPLLTAYKGASLCMMAEQVMNPYSKWSYFQEGRDLIERAVKADPRDAEVRYIRFVIQWNTPDFIGYHDDMTADRRLIEAAIQKASHKSEWMRTFERLTQGQPHPTTAAKS